MRLYTLTQLHFEVENLTFYSTTFLKPVVSFDVPFHDIHAWPVTGPNKCTCSASVPIRTHHVSCSLGVRCWWLRLRFTVYGCCLPATCLNLPSPPSLSLFSIHLPNFHCHVYSQSNNGRSARHWNWAPMAIFKRTFWSSGKEERIVHFLSAFSVCLRSIWFLLSRIRHPI